MILNPTQKATLKAHILASSDMNSLPPGPDSAFAIAALLNLVASPEFVVYRTRVTIDEIMNNGFVWDLVDNLTVGKARIWEWMTQLGSFNPSKTNIQAGINAAWVGSQPMLDQRAAIYVHCRRPATRLEKLFSLGAGTAGSPGTVAVEIVGEIDYETVLLAMAV